VTASEDPASVTTPKEADDTSPVRAVARAMDVLLSLVDGPLSLARIAERTSLTKPTAHRLLATLGRDQLIIQDPSTSDYMLGPACLGIADSVLRGLGGLGMLARTTLEGLAETSRETVALHVPAGTQRVCVEQVPSPQPVRYTSTVGVAKPIYTGAMGKVLLAFMGDESRDELMRRMPFTRVTDATIVDRDELGKQIRKAQVDGYSVSYGEQAEGVAAVSAPVFGINGHLLAALSVLGPANRLPRSTMEEIAPLVRKAAEEISVSLRHPEVVASTRRGATDI
jgi:DNA-binding IclR family transcriptional regulator